MRLDIGAGARFRRSWLGCGETRFVSPTRAFKVLCIGSSLTTVVAEHNVRDGFVQRRGRRLTQAEIERLGGPLSTGFDRTDPGHPGSAREALTRTKAYRPRASSAT